MGGLGTAIALLVLAEGVGLAVGLIATRNTPKLGAHGAPRHRNATFDAPRILILVAAISGMLAMVGPGAPTGWLPLDMALKALLGAGVVILSERVPTGILLASSILAAVGAVGSSIQPVATIASGLLLAAVVTSRRQPFVVALSVGGVVQASMRLQRPTIAGVTAVVAAVILLPIVLVGIARMPEGERRLVGRVLGGVVVFSVLASALGAVSALMARRPLERGLQQLSTAATVSSGSQSGALITRSGQLKDAASSFAVADSYLNSWWARLASAVPVVAQQARALRTAASIGHDLSSTGATALGGVAAADIHIEGGDIPLAKLTALEPTMSASSKSLHRATRRVQAIRSPWLLSPLGHRLDRESVRLTSTQTTVDNASDALRLLPDMLGGNGTRRYFLAVQTPSESRATGGLLGSFGEITADGGHLRLVKFEHLDALETGGDLAARRLIAPPDYVARYQQFNPQTEWANVNLSPDFPTDAAVIASLYPQSGGEPIDGVIAVDPTALAAILRVIGPVNVAGWPEPITADNAAQVLLYGQYAAVSTDAAAPARVDFLNALAQQAWSRLTTTFTGSPEQLLAGLASTISGKHLLLAATRPTEEALFRRLHATGAFPPVTGDFVGVVTQNAGGDKLDWFLHRQVDYAVQLDPASGSISATLKVTLRNDAPSTGTSFYFKSSLISPPLPRGDSKRYISIYSPWNLTAATLDGSPVQLQSERELGRNVYSGGVIIRAGSSDTLVLKLSGRLKSSPYRLDIFSQPMVNPDQVHTSLSLPWGWRLEGQVDRPSTSNFVLGKGDITITRPLSRRRWLW